MDNIPPEVRKNFNPTQKLLYILQQEAPNMKNSKFDFHIERIIGCSKLPEWHVILTYGTKKKDVIYEEIFKTKKEAETWAQQFVNRQRKV